MTLGRVIRTIVADPQTGTVYEKYINPQRKKIAQILHAKPENVSLSSILPEHGLWQMDESLWPRKRGQDIDLWYLKGLEEPLHGPVIIHGIRNSQSTSTTLLTSDIQRLVPWQTV